MKVLVIGSGPIVIGQAAEFDYAGTQACKSLKEEGHEVVLINSNPATIMTDPGVSDALYIEPLTVEFCERVIAREKPDALLPTLGGQTGLNLATQLSDHGILDKYGVKLLGTPLSAIKKAEDRESFRNLMREINEPVPESWIIQTPDELHAILDIVPYPCIIRPAYTLGGTGGGIANTKDELWEIGQKGLKLSMRSQIMVERSLLGWKEVEYEVMRDSAGNCITICNMENLDPMGVHTGDSIVIAPSQTLSDLEYHMLRTASLKIIQSLGIEGGCNVQLAVNPDSFDYYIIEVNPRVSRSSALASKATGYPIARVSAKIAVGKTLDEIENQVTGTTKACFEPALDYCIVKIPRWPFDKFASGDRSLFTQMKATGEVMAIDRSFEAAFMKAIRGLEIKQKDLRHTKFQGSPRIIRVERPATETEKLFNETMQALGSAKEEGREAAREKLAALKQKFAEVEYKIVIVDEGHAPMNDDDLKHELNKPTDERLWAVAEGLRRGWDVPTINKISRIDPWFLRKIQNLLLIEKRLTKAFETLGDSEELSALISEAFLIGFPSNTIKSLLGAETATAELKISKDMRANFVVSLQDSGLSEEKLDRVKSNLERSDAQPLVGSVHANYVSEHLHTLWTDKTIGQYLSYLELVIQEIERQKVMPVFKMVDTCAGEFESGTPYYYGTFEQEDDAH